MNINKLNYFLEKPITIITKQINRKFDEAQSIDYFTGICEEITEDGIFTYHPLTKCKNFVLFHSIVGIFEEQKVEGSILEELKEEKEEKSILNDNNTLNINELNKLIS